MYHPYFRGKQFELVTIRETAKMLAENNFTPIIEPVRESLAGLKKSVDAIKKANGKAVVVINPFYGDHHEDASVITDFLKSSPDTSGTIFAGIMLHSDMKIDDILKIKDQCPDHDTVFIHSGFTDPKKLSSMIDEGMSCVSNTFIEEHAKLLYRKHFNGHKRILLRDGFKRQRNADYPTLEEFSDLHVTYKELGMDGFGDFLTVGNAYSESGGPAYAVALHITFIDPSKDDVMYIYHFVSDTRDTPTDPAGKFSQALGKLIKKLNSNSSHIIETEAIKEFRLLHENGHFPGLGYIKKLSMKHHIETISVYLKASR